MFIILMVHARNFMLKLIYNDGARWFFLRINVSIMLKEAFNYDHFIHLNW